MNKTTFRFAATLIGLCILWRGSTTVSPIVTSQTPTESEPTNEAPIQIQNPAEKIPTPVKEKAAPRCPLRKDVPRQWSPGPPAASCSNNDAFSRWNGSHVIFDESCNHSIISGAPSWNVPSSTPVKNTGDHTWAFCTDNNVVRRNLHIHLRKKNVVGATRARSPSFVYIIFDAVSRHAFERDLPSSMEFMKQTNFASLEKLSIAGLGTNPNFPISQCGNKICTRKGTLTDRAKKAGYVTHYASDAPKRGSNAISSGAQPTPHYSFRHIFEDNFNRGYRADQTEAQCLNGTPRMAASYVLDHTLQFLQAHSGEPRFSLVHLEDAHDPEQTVLPNMDAMLLDFIKQARATGTGIVLASDHGIHYGPSWEFEEAFDDYRQAFFFFLAPPNFENLTSFVAKRKMYPASHFDTHKTMSAAMGLPTKPGIGQSLLDYVPPVPCDGIPSRYCLCSEWTNVSSETTSLEAQRVIQRHIDGIVRNKNVCMKIEITSVDKIRKLGSHYRVVTRSKATNGREAVWHHHLTQNKAGKLATVAREQFTRLTTFANDEARCSGDFPKTERKACMCK